MSIQMDDVITCGPSHALTKGQEAFERAAELFEAGSSEDELWRRFASELSSRYGIDHLLYGFTYSWLRAELTGVTRNLDFRHTYPADYVEAIGKETFLDDDVSTRAIMESDAPFLWSDAPSELPPEMSRRIEIDEAFGMSVGASFALRFADDRGFGGVGLCASRGTSEREFARLWLAEKRNLAILVSAFDTMVRDRMIGRLYRLAPRERDVLAFTSCGLSAKQIAHRLDLAPKSVSNALERARRSLGAGSTTEAIVKAYVYRLI